MKTRKLTARQQRFAEMYVELGGNGRQAALAAGYVSNTKCDSARVVSYKLLRNPLVLAAIKDEAEKRLKSNVAIGASVLEKLAKNAKSESVQLQAALALLDRGGLQLKSLSEHTLKIEDKRSDDELRARVEQLTRELGLKTIEMEPTKLAALTSPDVTDVEVK